MSNVTTGLFRTVIRGVSAFVLNAELSIPAQRKRLDLIGKTMLPPNGTKKEEILLGGRRCLKITGKWNQHNEQAGPVILYFHGGAFIIGSPESHYGLTAHMAKAAGGMAYSLDYRLAPEHPAPAATEDALAAYEALLKQGIPAERIIIAGDSAGGGLTLTGTLAIKAAGLPMPAGMMMIAPFVDGTLSGESMNIDDPVLTEAWMICGIQHYAAELPRNDPRISPLYADLAGLPPAYIQVGGQERLLEDARRIRKALEAAGVACQYLEVEDLWHVWQLFVSAGFSRAKSAVNEIGDWCQKQVSA